MTFRTRILIACVLAAAAPLIVFAIGARSALGNRLESQYLARVRTATEVVRADLARVAVSVDDRLEALATRVADDAILRAALVGASDATQLRDYAPLAMPATGLDYLVLVGEDGTVLSSGHFRNDYGRAMSALAPVLDASGPVLLAARRANGRFLALARAYEFTIGGRRFGVVGGIEVDSAFVRALARDTPATLALTLRYPGGALGPGTVEEDAFEQRVVMPYVDDALALPPDSAVWLIRHSRAPLRALHGSLDRWLLGALAGAILLAVIVARLLSARVNRPLEELASRGRRVDLDNPEISFATRRYDEVGSLARVLDGMLQRMRASAAQLRAAERRATVGEMARQVNHDIRNGLLPIRNVVHHLAEVADRTPDDLPGIFAERAGTLQGAITYLETLATSYARLAPAGERTPCDVNAIIRAALGDVTSTHPSSGMRHGGAARIQLELAQTSLIVFGDAVALRRIIENLAVNAVESLENGNGLVTIRTFDEERDGERRVVMTVADTGRGMDEPTVDRIFDDFYTTKERGSGLGLSIVRRLVADMGGSVRVQSHPGRGTTFRIELPEAQ